MAVVISTVSPKGGVGKSTSIIGLSQSRTFIARFKSICIIEFDPQGSLSQWAANRDWGEDMRFLKLVGYKNDVLKNVMLDILEKYECVFIDVPGESIAGFSTTFAMMISDLVLVPMRTSVFDENSFRFNLFPVINEVGNDVGGGIAFSSKFKILPYYTSPTANIDKLIAYFRQVLPTGIEPINATISRRSVLENFNRKGRDIHDYKKMVVKNKKAYIQASSAAAEFENLAQKIIETLDDRRPKGNRPVAKR